MDKKTILIGPVLCIVIAIAILCWIFWPEEKEIARETPPRFISEKLCVYASDLTFEEEVRCAKAEKILREKSYKTWEEKCGKGNVEENKASWGWGSWGAGRYTGCIDYSKVADKWLNEKGEKPK